jgi:hypothetical protein
MWIQCTDSKLRSREESTDGSHKRVCLNLPIWWNWNALFRMKTYIAVGVLVCLVTSFILLLVCQCALWPPLYCCWCASVPCDLLYIAVGVLVCLVTFFSLSKCDGFCSETFYCFAPTLWPQHVISARIRTRWSWQAGRQAGRQILKRHRKDTYIKWSGVNWCSALVGCLRKVALRFL